MRLIAGVLACALAHFAIVFIIGSWAGMTGSGPLAAATNALSFPLQFLLPADKPAQATDWILIALVSLTWGAFIFFAVRFVIERFGAPGALALLVLAAVGVVGALAAAGTFTATQPLTLVEQRLAGRLIKAPAGFTTVTYDSALQADLAEEAGAEAGPRIERAYMNYRPTLSGQSEYDAALIVAPAALFQTTEDFAREVDFQKDPTWRAARWSGVATGADWAMEEGMPNMAPLPERTRNRLIRIRATAPTEGLWLALVAYERTIPRARAQAIFAEMTASLAPE
jgi:hypothetical protein